jgi:branched-chain amino acid transport system substrate-binding protein
VEVKSPDESESEWDLLDVVSRIPADQAYISMEDTKCGLVNK